MELSYSEESYSTLILGEFIFELFAYEFELSENTNELLNSNLSSPNSLDSLFLWDVGWDLSTFDIE